MELLQVLTLNLCGFDPGLEAGSILAIKSNLVIYLVPYQYPRWQQEIYTNSVSKLTFLYQDMVMTFAKKIIYLVLYINIFPRMIIKQLCI